MLIIIIIGITKIFAANGCALGASVSLWRPAVPASQRVLALPKQEYIRA